MQRGWESEIGGSRSGTEMVGGDYSSRPRPCMGCSAWLDGWMDGNRRSDVASILARKLIVMLNINILMYTSPNNTKKDRIKQYPYVSLEILLYNEHCIHGKEIFV
jgi:hypothetical protein